MAKKKPHKKKSPSTQKRGSKTLSKSDQRLYDKLRQQVSRAKRNISAENKKFDYGKKRGRINKARKQRSEQYKKLTYANKELIKFRKKRGIGEPVRKKRISTEEKRINNTIVYTYAVWKFEQIFADYINKEKWKYIVFANSGIKVNAKKTPPSELFSLYDNERDAAYIKLFAVTPWVNVTEDELKRTLTLEFWS